MHFTILPRSGRSLAPSPNFVMIKVIRWLQLELGPVGLSITLKGLRRLSFRIFSNGLHGITMRYLYPTDLEIPCQKAMHEVISGILRKYDAVKYSAVGV